MLILSFLSVELGEGTVGLFTGINYDWLVSVTGTLLDGFSVCSEVRVSPMC